MARIKWLSIACGILLLSGIPSFWPYSFYQLLRVFIFGTSALVAHSQYRVKRIRWVLIFSAICLLFNPLFPLYLDKQLWAIVDLVASICFFVTGRFYWKSPGGLGNGQTKREQEMPNEPDYYEILQVAAHADLEVIEAAYRRLARKYHPDVDKSPNATKRMKEINQAFEVIGNKTKRAEYDRRRGQTSHSPRWTSSGPTPDNAESSSKNSGYSSPGESQQSSDTNSNRQPTSTVGKGKKITFRQHYIYLGWPLFLIIMVSMYFLKSSDTNLTFSKEFVLTPTSTVIQRQQGKGESPGVVAPRPTSTATKTPPTLTPTKIPPTITPVPVIPTRAVVPATSTPYVVKEYVDKRPGGGTYYTQEWSNGEVTRPVYVGAGPVKTPVARNQEVTMPFFASKNSMCSLTIPELNLVLIEPFRTWQITYWEISWTVPNDVRLVPGNKYNVLAQCTCEQKTVSASTSFTVR